ncbi:F-box/WD repeat-containing protein 9, partial [Temnothorax longispinosus]
RDTWFSFDPLKLHVLNPKDDFKIVKSYSTKHTGNITGVHLTHGCLITSSRDGTVRISSLTDPSKPIATLRSEMRHILDMDYRNDTLAVSGLSGAEVYFHRRKSDNLHSSFCGLYHISSCPESNLFATGSSCGTIYVCDSRSRNNPIRHYRPHTKPVNSLAMNTEYILSASVNDDTMSVWDQRAGRTMESITFPGKPTCINMRRDLVFVGDKIPYSLYSKLHVLNPKDDFKLVKSYSTKHTKSITSMHLTHGCLITSSWDGTVRISSLTDPSKPIATLRSKMRHILDMDYLNDTLAVSGYSGVQVWCPKLTCSTKQQ